MISQALAARVGTPQSQKGSINVHAWALIHDTQQQAPGRIMAGVVSQGSSELGIEAVIYALEIMSVRSFFPLNFLWTQNVLDT